MQERDRENSPQSGGEKEEGVSDETAHEGFLYPIAESL